MIEAYFISSSVLQRSHFNFHGAISKLKVKSEKMAEYSKKAKKSLSGEPNYKVKQAQLPR